MKSKLINLFAAATLLTGGTACVPMHHYQPERPPKVEHYQGISSLEQLVDATYCLRTHNRYEDANGNEIKSGAFGSSFAYKESDGFFYLLTNQHVVGAQEETINGTKYERKEALVEIVDSKFDKHKLDDILLEVVFESEELDLAILRTREKVNLLNENSFADSNILNYGDKVYLVGYPFGMFPATTEGIVANPGDYPFEFDLEDEKNGVVVPYSTKKVLDITINPGNSGGPFFVEREGQFYWMGLANAYYVNTAGGPFHRENSGLAIAMESNIIKEIADYVIMNIDDYIGECKM